MIAAFARIACASAFLLAVCAGCVTGSDGPCVLIAAGQVEPGVTTKEELLRLLGSPTDLRREGQDTVLSYAFAETHGTGYGFGLTGVGLDFVQTHSGVDWLEVRVGPERLVRGVRVVRADKRTPIVP